MYLFSDMIGEILQDDIVLTCINRISDPHVVLNWLFHLSKYIFST